MNRIPYFVLRSAYSTCRMRSIREVASSMVTAGAAANTTNKNSRASRESACLGSHSNGKDARGEGGYTYETSIGSK